MISKDRLWKSMIEDLFEEMMAFFYPEYLDQFDFSDVVFLDQELLQLFPESETSTSYADKLVKVRSKSGGSWWLMIHIEVQGYRDPSFPERMFRYYYRIYDRYNIPVESLAILTDPSPHFIPRAHTIKTLRTCLQFDFHSYKVLAQDEARLKADSRPFAYLMYITLRFLKLGKLTDEGLLEQKIQFFRMLIAKGYSREMITHFTIFIKKYVSFNQEIEFDSLFDQYSREIQKIESNMGIIELYQNYERQKAEERGMEEGIVKIIRIPLLKGHSVDQVCEFLDQPRERVEKIYNQLVQEGLIHPNT